MGENIFRWLVKKRNQCEEAGGKRSFDVTAELLAELLRFDPGIMSLGRNSRKEKGAGSE